MNCVPAICLQLGADGANGTLSFGPPEPAVCPLRVETIDAHDDADGDEHQKDEREPVYPDALPGDQQQEERGGCHENRLQAQFDAPLPCVLTGGTGRRLRELSLGHAQFIGSHWWCLRVGFVVPGIARVGLCGPR